MKAFIVLILTAAILLASSSLKIGFELKGEINQLNKDLARQDSLISLFRKNEGLTIRVKNHDLKSLKYRIYSIDRNQVVSQNELSEILMEIVLEIEKLEKP